MRIITNLYYMQNSIRSRTQGLFLKQRGEERPGTKLVTFKLRDRRTLQIRFKLSII